MSLLGVASVAATHWLSGRGGGHSKKKSIVSLPADLIAFRDVLWNQLAPPSHSHLLPDKLAASQPASQLPSQQAGRPLATVGGSKMKTETESTTLSIWSRRPGWRCSPNMPASILLTLLGAAPGEKKNKKISGGCWRRLLWLWAFKIQQRLVKSLEGILFNKDPRRSGRVGQYD